MHRTSDLQALLALTEPRFVRSLLCQRAARYLASTALAATADVDDHWTIPMGDERDCDGVSISLTADTSAASSCSLWGAMHTPVFNAATLCCIFVHACPQRISRHAGARRLRPNTDRHKLETKATNGNRAVYYIRDALSGCPRPRSEMAVLWLDARDPEPSPMIGSDIDFGPSTTSRAQAASIIVAEGLSYPPAAGSTALRGDRPAGAMLPSINPASVHTTAKFNYEDARPRPCAVHETKLFRVTYNGFMQASAGLRTAPFPASLLSQAAPRHQSEQSPTRKDDADRNANANANELRYQQPARTAAALPPARMPAAAQISYAAMHGMASRANALPYIRSAPVPRLSSSEHPPSTPATAYTYGSRYSTPWSEQMDHAESAPLRAAAPRAQLELRDQSGRCNAVAPYTDGCLRP
ncbi:hypothetical protein EVG20_g4008 [Dentipellis fragilis]|uniref:Uncharacterized protein n=1 Tax=Dentipellis fragilis TaxID=205917 RepID=A0A4Y9YZQ2_9AGAM|nr:hypothetical protein EVG20_g4008 [Dentipellis fragilis]